MLRIEPTLEPTYPPDMAGRTLHLVDVENLVGSAAFSASEASWICSAYERVAPVGSVNQMVIATSHHAAATTWFAWPANARRLQRSGPDGADLALLELFERESIAVRFQHVVIGSGDGIFALPAARLHAAGCRVTIVSRREALSRELRLAVRDVRFIDRAAPELAIRLGAA